MGRSANRGGRAAVIVATLLVSCMGIGGSVAPVRAQGCDRGDQIGGDGTCYRNGQPTGRNNRPTPESRLALCQSLYDRLDGGPREIELYKQAECPSLYKPVPREAEQRFRAPPPPDPATWPSRDQLVRALKGQDMAGWPNQYTPGSSFEFKIMGCKPTPLTNARKVYPKEQNCIYRQRDTSPNGNPAWFQYQVFVFPKSDGAWQMSEVPKMEACGGARWEC